MKEAEMSRICSTHGRTDTLRQESWMKGLTTRQGLGQCGRIILKWIQKRNDHRLLAGINFFPNSDKRLAVLKTVNKFSFHENLVISSVYKRLLLSTNEDARVEACSNTSTVALRVVRGDGKGTQWPGV
jgi:hypothetical protein